MVCCNTIHSLPYCCWAGSAYTIGGREANPHLPGDPARTGEWRTRADSRPNCIEISKDICSSREIYRSGNYRRYGYRTFPPPFYGIRPYGPRRPEGYYPEGAPYDWAYSPARFLASTLIDRQVISESDGYIGRVADLLIDARDAKVKNVLLLAEEIRGDDSRVLIPYEPPGFTAYGIVWDISSKEIRNLPDYRADK